MPSISAPINSPHPYLIFRLYQPLYAVKASHVLEIIWLPELTHIEEAPPYVAGVFNLRGKIVPVIDLALRFGHKSLPYKISDSVVVMEIENKLMGIIVSEVLDVINISPADIEQQPEFRHEKPGPHFLEGEAKTTDDIIMLLNTVNLVKHIGPLEEGAEIEPELDEYPLFCPEATPPEKAIFRDRARNLRQNLEADALSGFKPIAVVGIGEEYFGFDVASVREFTNVHRVTKVPCCPPHIIGNMNLRGNIITLVDIRPLLNLPGGGPEARKALITELEETLVGIAVDEILDVVNIQKPEGEGGHAGAMPYERYIKGTAPYGGKMMTLLNLEKILADGELAVNEEA